MQNPFKKAYILPAIIVAAIALVVFKVKTRPEISHQALSFPRQTVEVIELQKIPFRNRATAYGYVEPAITLKSKAEVSGKIIYIHPRLKKGASLPEGTVVLRIEPTTFEFSRDQSEALLSSSQALILVPLVASIIFGMLTSTVLIMLVLPALYGIMEDIGYVKFRGTVRE